MSNIASEPGLHVETLLGHGKSADADAVDILNILSRRKFILALGVLSALAVAGVYLAMAPLRYQSAAVLLLDPRLGKTLDAARTGQALADAAALDSQVKMMTSQTVLEKLVKSAGLADNPEFRSKPGLIARLLGSKEAPPSDAVDYAVLEKAFTIKRPERTLVVEIQATGKDAAEAATLANGLARAYIEDQIASRVESASNDSKWLRQVLADAQAELAATDAKIQAFKARNNLVAATGQKTDEIDVMQVADVTRQLDSAHAKTSEAKAHYDLALRGARDGRLGEASDSLKSSTIERLRSQQAEAAREVARLSQTLGEHHPALREAQAQARSIAALLNDEQRRIAESARSDFELARAHELRLAQSIAGLKKRTNASGPLLLELSQMDHSADILRARIDELSKSQVGLLQDQVDSPPARIIASARPSVSPSSPRRLPVLLIALAAGLFGGVGAALLKESRAPRGQLRNTAIS